MKRGYLMVTLGGLLLLGAVSSGYAAPHDRFERDRVCVYEHAGYGGWEECFRAGESIRDLGKRRNRISSVRIFGQAEVTLFEYPDFNGNTVSIREDIADLSQWRRWNDQTDSLRVDHGRVAGRPRYGDRGDDRVCVYQHINYQGRSQCFDAGDEIHDLQRLGWNDSISSIRTFGRARLAIYEHIQFDGQRLVADRDIPDLTQVGTRDGLSWNDRISSIRIRDERGHHRRD